MILLDTHALVWFAEDNPRLGRRTTALVNAALLREEVTVSAISFWGITMLVEKRRLRLELPAREVRRKVLEQGIREIALTGDVAIEAARLGGFHGDPADRMIVATAQSSDATLVTADDAILTWRGRLNTQDARR
ncbi:MAG: type II toxin-antitoxin system VapC family toxin [Candidatus Binatia bacterium]